MKAILMSIRPKWVAKILNGEKTIEIRKKFPSDYVGWVYIYVTKGKPYLSSNSFKYYIAEHYEEYMGNWNGKVVARFWCNKVEKFDRIMVDFEREDLKQNACLSQLELDNYIKDNIGYAIHINDLEIFDKPKEISEFYKIGYENSVTATTKYILCSMNREERRKYKTELDLKINNEIAVIKDNYKLTRAPQSWCYVEI